MRFVGALIQLNAACTAQIHLMEEHCALSTALNRAEDFLLRNSWKIFQLNAMLSNEMNMGFRCVFTSSAYPKKVRLAGITELVIH